MNREKFVGAAMQTRLKIMIFVLFIIQVGIANAQSVEILREGDLIITMTCQKNADNSDFTEIQHYGRHGRYLLLKATKGHQIQVSYRLVVDYFPCFYDIHGDVATSIGNKDTATSEPPYEKVEIEGSIFRDLYSKKNQVGIVRRLKEDCGSAPWGGLSYPWINVRFPHSASERCRNQIARILETESTELSLRSRNDSWPQVNILMVMGSPYVEGKEFGKW